MVATVYLSGARYLISCERKIFYIKKNNVCLSLYIIQQSEVAQASSFHSSLSVCCRFLPVTSELSTVRPLGERMISSASH